MLREHIFEPRTVGQDGFRWRGIEPTRLEALTDGVLAFALTLIIVSLEVPRTYSQLLRVMSGFLGFAICATFLFGIWWGHNAYCRRFGLQDYFTQVLTGVLLFVVLFYVYPLKFLFTLLVAMFSGGRLAGTVFSETQTRVIESWQWPSLMMIYGAGFIAVYLVFTLLYWHAWRLRDSLELNERERIITFFNIEGYLINVGVGVLSMLIAWTGGPGLAAISGMTYSLLGPLRGFHGWRLGRRLDAMDRAAGS